MQTLSDTQQRILKEEYPNMTFESDSDVERYFEMRKNGRQADALNLYNTRLKRKFPDEHQRTMLMRYYRSHDPRYAEILRDSMLRLAERLVSRTTYVISLLTKDIDTVDMTDAYSVIKLAEGLLSIISPDRYVAISFTEKYVRYAKALNYRQELMERTAELIRLYVTDTIESVQELKKEKEESRKQRLKQQVSRKKQPAGFDLSKIKFSPEDVSRIVIPSSITRTEDIVISYCLKYWNLATDPAFEKTIFLYSRKYNTRNYEIFQVLQNGRLHNWKDEEILNAVLATVITGYYYSISGDLYLQHTWARYKTTYLGANIQPETHKPEEKTEHAIRAAEKNRKKKEASLLKKKEKVASKATKRNAVVSPKKIKPVTPFKTSSKSVKEKKIVLPANPVFIPNSISDIIRKLTGKTYTVYKELFFKGIRPSIRTILTSSAAKKGSRFGKKQNEAEEIIYDFLFAHYNNPYQNWKESGERKQVEELGYHLPEIEPIIAGWIQSNK